MITYEQIFESYVLQRHFSYRKKHYYREINTLNWYIYMNKRDCYSSWFSFLFFCNRLSKRVLVQKSKENIAYRHEINKKHALRAFETLSKGIFTLELLEWLKIRVSSRNKYLEMEFDAMQDNKVRLL